MEKKLYFCTEIFNNKFLIKFYAKQLRSRFHYDSRFV